MSASAYGRESASGDSPYYWLKVVCVIAGLLTAVGIGIVVFGNTIYVPLAVHWDERLIAYNKAQAHLQHPICNNVELRAGLNGYDDCKTHRETASHLPLALAVRDLLEDYWCEKGKCLVPRFDLFTLIFSVLPTVMLVGFVVVAALSCFIFLRVWRGAERRDELPYAKYSLAPAPPMPSKSTLDDIAGIVYDKLAAKKMN
jgi:hypothetical protein